MKNVFLVRVSLMILLQLNTAFGTKGAIYSSSLYSSDISKEEVLNYIRIYCSKPINLCDSTEPLYPLIELLLNQTMEGCENYKYKNKFVNVMKHFSSQFNLKAISSYHKDPHIVAEFIENLKTYAVAEFRGTSVYAQIRKTYEDFERRVSQEQVVGLIIGKNTGEIIESYLLAINVGFADHPDLTMMRDMFIKLQYTYNQGSTAMWKEFVRIVTNMGIVPWDFKATLDKIIKSMQYLSEEIEETRTRQKTYDDKYKTTMEHTLNSIAALKRPNNGVFIWEINEFSQKMASGKASTLTIYSDDFYSSEYGYKMKLEVNFGKGAMGVFVRFMPGENNAHLPAVFHHRRVYSVLDQSDREDKRNVIRIDEPHLRDGLAEKYMSRSYGVVDVFNYSLLESKHENMFVKNNKMFVKVVVEPTSALSKNPFSNDGVLVWTVSNYQRTKQEAFDMINRYPYSDYFYSSPRGYRMKCYLVFSQDRLTIYLNFYKGEYDDHLLDIYPHKVTFAMLNQIDSSKYSSLYYQSSLDPKEIGFKNAKDRMISTGCSEATFLFSSLEKSPFLVDDTILIKITVEPI